MKLLKTTYILFLILSINLNISFSAENKNKEKAGGKTKKKAKSEYTGDPEEIQRQQKKEKYSKVMEKGFSLIKENKKQNAVKQFEQIIFAYKNPLFYFPKLDQIFKPDTKNSLVEEISKRAEQFYKEKYYKKALLLYKFLVRFNKTNVTIIKSFNKTYDKYKEILTTINQALEDVEQGKFLSARDKLRVAVRSLSLGDKGNLFESTNKRLKKIDKFLVTKRRPKQINDAKVYLKNKDFDRAEKAVKTAIKIKNSPELQKLLKNIQYSRLGERLRKLFEDAEKKFLAKKFDEAIAVLKIIKKDFSKNENVVKDADEKIVLYTKHKKAHNFKTAGLKYFNEKKWKLALKNFQDYLKVWEKPDKDIEDKIQICRLKLISIAKRKEFDKKYNSAISLYKSQKYADAKRAFISLKESYPFKTKEIENYIKMITNLINTKIRLALLAEFNKKFAKAVKFFNEKEYLRAKALLEHLQKKYPFGEKKVKEYLTRINDILEKQKRLAFMITEAGRQFKLGESKFNSASKDKRSTIKARVNQIEDAKVNFYSAQKIYSELKRPKDVARCDEMIKRCNRKIKNIKKLENKRLRELVERLIKQGKKSFDQQKFQRAIVTFNKVLEILPDNEEAQRYLKSAREALLVKSESKVTPEHRRYNEYLAFSTRGTELYNNAEIIFKKQRKLTKESEDLYTKSLSQWRTILTWFPNNELAFEFIKRIYKRIDPKGYIEFLNDYVVKIRAYLRPPNMQKERAYALLLKIRKEDRAYFYRARLNILLERAKPQRLVRRLTPAQKTNVRQLYQIALAEFSKKNDNKVIGITNQAIKINPFATDIEMNNVKRLQRQAINRKRFGQGGGISQPGGDTYKKYVRLYYMAMAAYNKKQYRRGLQIINAALRIMRRPNGIQLRDVLKGKLKQ